MVKAINLGNLIEREETTDYAREKINSFIGNKEYHLALMIAHIYTGIRLKTLLIDWVTENRNEPIEENWKKIAGIFKDVYFNACLKNCKNLKLVNNDEYEKFKMLQTKRNEVAHESRLWRIEPPLKEINDIKSICDSVIAFLENKLSR